MWWIVFDDNPLAVIERLDGPGIEAGDPSFTLAALRERGFAGRVVYERPPNAPPPMSEEQMEAALTLLKAT